MTDWWKRSPFNKIEWNKNTVAMAALAGVYLFFFVASLYNILGEHHERGILSVLGFRFDLGDAYDDTRDKVSFYLSVLFLLLGGLGLFYRRMSDTLRRAYFGVLLALVCVALFLVYMKPGVIKDYYADTGDSFNYFVVPKYYEELGYRESYNCAMTAQMERARKLPRRMRNLSNNRMVEVKERVTPDVQKRCRALFGEERWAQYVEDIDTYRSWFNQRRWDHWFIDHGYNGTPVRSIFASFLSNRVDLSIQNISLFSLLNTLFITAMLMMSVYTFGWRAGLFFAALCVVNYPDRFIHNGAFLRYVWLATAVFGVSFLKTRRYGLAAGFLVFSALYQIFPVLFLAGMGGKIAWDIYQKRRLSPGHRRFIVSGFVTALVLLGLSVSVGRGFQNWSEFTHQMELNSGRMATGRIGHLYNFLLPKEMDKDEKREPYQDKVRRAKSAGVIGGITLWDIKQLTTLIILVAVLLLVGKTNETEYTLLVGFALFFMLFSTVRYYYAGLLGFPLIFHRHMRGLPGQIYMLAMLAVMAIAYWLQPDTIYSFVYNTWLTAAFTVMLVGTVVFLYLRKTPAEEVSP